VTWGFHEGVSAVYSRMIPLYGENRFYRHVASHWIEMQQAMIAMIIGGVFEFHPGCGGLPGSPELLGAGLLSRIEWDYPQYRDSHAPYLTLMPREYFRRTVGRPWRERAGDRGHGRPHRRRPDVHLDGLSTLRLELSHVRTIS